jgi:hypothetical protein
MDVIELNTELEPLFPNNAVYAPPPTPAPPAPTVIEYPVCETEKLLAVR